MKNLHEKVAFTAKGKQFVAFSGGKDSTALVLRLAELHEPFELIFTATGNELPELHAHIQSVVQAAGNPPLHRPPAPHWSSS